MISQTQFNGIWYNDNYKLTVTNGQILLNTNFDTIHKPFYTRELQNEELIWDENDKTVKISRNITLLKNESISGVIVISLDTDRGLQMIRLIKFEN